MKQSRPKTPVQFRCEIVPYFQWVALGCGALLFAPISGYAALFGAAIGWVWGRWGKPVRLVRLRPSRKALSTWLEVSPWVPATQKRAFALFDQVQCFQCTQNAQTVEGFLHLNSGETRRLEVAPLGESEDLRARLKRASEVLGVPFQAS